MLFLLLFILIKKRKIFLFKKIFIEKDIIFFLENLGLLLESGLPIDKAIEISIEGVKEKIEFYLLRGVKNGVSLSDILKNIGGLTEIEVALIRLAEETGRLSEVLNEISDDKKKNIRVKLRVVLKLLEPFVLFLIGIFIGFFVIGLYIPILNFSEIIEI